MWLSPNGAFNSPQAFIWLRKSITLPFTRQQLMVNCPYFVLALSLSCPESDSINSKPKIPFAISRAGFKKFVSHTKYIKVPLPPEMFPSFSKVIDRLGTRKVLRKCSHLPLH